MQGDGGKEGLAQRLGRLAGGLRLAHFFENFLNLRRRGDGLDGRPVGFRRRLHGLGEFLRVDNHFCNAEMLVAHRPGQGILAPLVFGFGIGAGLHQHARHLLLTFAGAHHQRGRVIRRACIDVRTPLDQQARNPVMAGEGGVMQRVPLLARAVYFGAAF